MSNVRHIRPVPDFDHDITEVIRMVNPPTEPEGIAVPFATLLQGPASLPESDPLPSPYEVPWPTFGVVAGAYFIGVLQAALVIRFFS